ncbi:MAG: hypothetical protein H6728_16805 [Myxococcales bacterium]|nr:hypothetical protein [Myxococcales bacterium]MCB9644736.1 hypothetical protein [Myxococcales bacterium]
MEKEKELEANNTQPEDAQEKEASAQPRPDNTRRNNQRRNQRRKDNAPRADEKDEDFGNRKDYQPTHAIGGYYREPMAGGDHWNRRNNRNHRHNHHNQREIEGVLSVNQPGWQQHLARQMEQDRNNVLTMRQQEHTSQALDRRYNNTLRSHEQRSQDPDAVWSRFMDDLKRGKIHPDGRPKRNNHRNNNNNNHKRRKHNNRPQNQDAAPQSAPSETQDKDKE